MSSVQVNAKRLAVIYLRLSVAGDEDSTSIVKMRKDCIDWCERQDIAWSEDRILVDDGLSGGIRRAKADTALSWLRDGTADVLVTWKYDRWSRQGIQAVGELMGTLLQTTPRTRFVAIMDGLDSDMQFFPMLAGMISELARIERENIKLRVRTTQELLATQGRYKGGKRVFGYAPLKLDTGGYALGADDVQYPILREIVERIIAGEKANSIAEDLNRRIDAEPDEKLRKRMAPQSGHWQGNTIRRFLTHPILRGMHVYRVDWKKWPIEYNVQLDTATNLPIRPHAAVVTDDEWFKLQDALMADSPRNYGQNREGHMLLGLVRCAFCGSPMSRKDEKARDLKQLVCTRRNRDIPCPGNGIQRGYVEARVEREFLDLFGDTPLFEHTEVEEDTTRVREITEALEVVGRRMRDARTRQEEREWSDRKWGLMEELERLETTLTGQKRVELRDTGFTYAEMWAGANENTKRSYLAEMGCKVEIARAEKRPGLDTKGQEFAESRITVRFLTDDADETVVAA